MKMEETLFIAIVTICIAAIVKSITNLLANKKKNVKGLRLPPGPPAVPILGNLQVLGKTLSQLERPLRKLKHKYGPIITLKIGPKTIIFVFSHSVAYKALIQNGAVFSDRPRGLATSKLLTSNDHNIHSAVYGPMWRLLRRNLASDNLKPSHLKSFSHARRWALGNLIRRLLESSSGSISAKPVQVIGHFRHVVFSLLLFMCVGGKLDEDQTKGIEDVHRRLMFNLERYTILNFWPRLGKIVFHKLWREFAELRRSQEDVLIPVIHDRKRLREEKRRKAEDGKSEDVVAQDDAVVGYIDSLLDLEVPDEKRKFDDGELVSLCSEYLTGGSDTTSTTLEWIMLNLVKNPQIQAKLYKEITSIVGQPSSPASLNGEEGSIEFVKEEDLQKMTYLKAVVMEGLRRHPPGHFTLPRSVTEDVELEGYLVPKNSTVFFMVGEMGLDPEVWEDPMEFKPERFLTAGDQPQIAGEVFDVTGSKEIKMIPFGAGRRICPGTALAFLHLEFFLANLVWYFEWTAGDEVTNLSDLSDKFEFTFAKKNPLLARISPRII